MLTILTDRLTEGSASASFTSVMSAIRRSAFAAINFFRRCVNQHRALRELQQLTDADLRDLRVHRSELPALALQEARRRGRLLARAE
jgi:uncharacterized protein YjiS (DUF1127 family)